MTAVARLKKDIAKRAKYALRRLPDVVYLRLYYRLRAGKRLNLKNPVRYNEKLQWLKLHDRDPLYPILVDKASAKSWAAGKIGPDHVVQTLGSWDTFDDIDFESLPTQFVLKCTHDSEGVAVIKDKSVVDLVSMKDKFDQALKQNFYYIGREWPYSMVRPRIIAEEYLEDSTSKELADYKFFCFDGEPKALFVASGRNSGHTKFDYFDVNFERLNLRQKYPNSDASIARPKTYDQMVECARSLSAGIPHARIDFYEVNGWLYFGELTLYHFSGFVPFEPDEWDFVFGSWLNLPSEQNPSIE